MGTYNKFVKFGQKIPNRFVKKCQKISGGGIFFDSLYSKKCVIMQVTIRQNIWRSGPLEAYSAPHTPSCISAVGIGTREREGRHERETG